MKTKRGKKLRLKYKFARLYYFRKRNYPDYYRERLAFYERSLYDIQKVLGK